jgi:hypothetical protein
MIYFFYHKSFVYISITHTIHIFLYFFITLFKFYKNVCKEMCTNHDLFFFISRRLFKSQHNTLFLYYIVNFVLVVNVFLALY